MKHTWSDIILTLIGIVFIAWIACIIYGPKVIAKEQKGLKNEVVSLNWDVEDLKKQLKESKEREEYLLLRGNLCD